jgi:hypothetical protein
MTKLYPIGTLLITKRLSQAALFVDVFPESSTEFASFFDPDDEVGVRHLVGFCLSADEWRITVTEDNQPWLSPLILVGDYVHFKKPNFGFEVNRIIADEVFESDEPFWYATIEDEPKIISRFYPNGQRASLIEWDEVILPTGQTPDSHPAL